MRRSLPTSLVAIGLLAASLCAAQAAPWTRRPAKTFADMSLEELMNETVTSVSKKEQRLGDVAAAITVISNEDLLRSGATSIPEALRLVPGMQIAEVNSSAVGVSARGFNGVFANKLLVLIDGRSVYSPMFSGVNWDLQQTMLEDVDRIEVIRGPGAAIWGANAVSGVINVTTRSARDTPGSLLYAGGGDTKQVIGGARHGGQLGENTFYRVFASHHKTADFPLADGRPANDRWDGVHGGFRLDRYSPADSQLTWQADATSVELAAGAGDGFNFNTLGRGTKQFSPDSSAEIQVYYDRSVRNEPIVLSTTIETVDIAAQHTFAPSHRHDIIWGAGFRATSTVATDHAPLTFIRKNRDRVNLFSAFAQDDFKAVPERLTLTAGVKVEHNGITGFEFEPSLRATLKPGAQQALWAAVSRAIRMPSEAESRNLFSAQFGAPFVGPGGGLYVPTVVGDGHLLSEVLWAFEAGYRAQVGRRVSADLAIFYNDYSHLIDVDSIPRFVPGLPVGSAEMAFANLFEGHAYGGEATVNFSPSERWQLTASYSLLIMRLQGAAGQNPAALERASPKHQFSLRSSYRLSARTTGDALVRYVGQSPGVPSYVAADLRCAYLLTSQLEISVVGQNLFDPSHPEQPTQPGTLTTEVPRRFYAKATWRL